MIWWERSWISSQLGTKWTETSFVLVFLNTMFKSISPHFRWKQGESCRLSWDLCRQPRHILFRDLLATPKRISECINRDILCSQLLVCSLFENFPSKTFTTERLCFGLDSTGELRDCLGSQFSPNSQLLFTIMNTISRDCSIILTCLHGTLAELFPLTTSEKTPMWIGQRIKSPSTSRFTETCIDIDIESQDTFLGTVPWASR